MSLSDLPDKLVEVFEDAFGADRFPITVGACSFVYSCIGGYCLQRWSYAKPSSTYCARFDSSSDVPAAPPAPTVTDACVDFASSGFSTPKELWGTCLRMCGCPRSVIKCCGAGGAPAIECAPHDAQPCYKSFGASCTRTVCRATCDAAGTAACVDNSCTGAACDRQCSCKPDAGAARRGALDASRRGALVASLPNAPPRLLQRLPADRFGQSPGARIAGDARRRGDRRRCVVALVNAKKKNKV